MESPAANREHLLGALARCADDEDVPESLLVLPVGAGEFFADLRRRPLRPGLLPRGVARGPLSDARMRGKGLEQLAVSRGLPQVLRTDHGPEFCGRAMLTWAHERGHEIIVTDWRVTNLLASRFWPSRGFRPTFLRLYRHIP